MYMFVNINKSEEKRQYKLLFAAVAGFLYRYDIFTETRTIEANIACNNALERLRDIIYMDDSPCD